MAFHLDVDILGDFCNPRCFGGFGSVDSFISYRMREVESALFGFSAVFGYSSFAPVGSYDLSRSFVLGQMIGRRFGESAGRRLIIGGLSERFRESLVLLTLDFSPSFTGHLRQFGVCY